MFLLCSIGKDATLYAGWRPLEGPGMLSWVIRDRYCCDCNKWQIVSNGSVRQAPYKSSTSGASLKANSTSNVRPRSNRIGFRRAN